MKTTTKPLRTNSAPVREKIRQHILECVREDGIPWDTLEDACSYAMSEFDRVANFPHNLKRFPNDQERFSDFLWGLPFCFEFEDHKISKFIDGLGINPDGKEWPKEKTNKIYHYLIWSEIQKATA